MRISLVIIFGEARMRELLYKDLTYSIRRCIFDVQNDIGVGFEEETYHQGLSRKFKQEGISFISKSRTKLKHREILIREFVLDFLVEDKIILSLKCLPGDFLPVNYIQIFTELKLWKKHLGILVNFGQPKVIIERRVFHEKLLVIDENYDFIKNQINEKERQIMKELRDSILFIGKLHGLGFGKPIVQKLVEAELKHQGIRFEKGVSIPVSYLNETHSNFQNALSFD